MELSDDMCRYSNLIDKLDAMGVDYGSRYYMKVLLKFLDVTPKALANHPELLAYHNARIRREIPIMERCGVDSKTMSKVLSYLD
jgi:hypothetical protein